MRKRIIFGVLGVVYLIFMFLLGNWFFSLSLLVFALIGAKEFYAAFRNKGFSPVNLLGYLSILVLFFGLIYERNLPVNHILVLFGLFAFAVPIFIQKQQPIDTAITFAGFFYPGVLLSYILLLKELPNPYRDSLLILALVATFATDTFAYFAGVSLGKHKLCPSISPKKTIEGSLGGMIGSLLLSLLVGLFLNRVYTIQIHPAHFAAIGLLAGMFSQVGDLSASVIKRYCNIKDFGNVLPGHGGILDRFDSLLFTAPLIFCYYLFFLA